MSANSTRQRARLIFFRKTRDHAPEVLSSLEQQVFHLYKAMLNSGSEHAGLYLDYRLTPFELLVGARLGLSNLQQALSDCTTDEHEVIRLQHAICTWLKRWNLTEEWCVDEVLQTLFQWHIPLNVGDWAYVTVDKDMEPSPMMVLKFIYGPWDVEADTWREYEKKVRLAFTQELSEYRDWIRASAQRNDLSFVSGKKDSSDHHFDWLVKFQVQGKEVSELVNTHRGSANVDPSTIHEAIHSTAKLIGLKLRAAKVGRHS